MAAGMAVDDFAPRLSFFFNAHSDFFEEIAKYRAARRIWARWMRERYGAADGRSCQLRFHTQTAGVSLTAQQPEVNLVRVAIEALAGVLGGTQSLHTDCLRRGAGAPDRARGPPGPADAAGHRRGDRASSTWPIRSVARGSSRSSPTSWSARPRRSSRTSTEAGSGSMLEGVFACIDDGWFVAEIADAAYAFQSKIAEASGPWSGVNGYVEDDGVAPSTLSIGADVETEQLERLAADQAGAGRRRGPPFPGPHRQGRVGPDGQPDAGPHRGGPPSRDRRRVDAGARVGLRALHRAPRRLISGGAVGPAHLWCRLFVPPAAPHRALGEDARSFSVLYSGILTSMTRRNVPVAELCRPGTRGGTCRRREVRGVPGDAPGHAG